MSSRMPAPAESSTPYQGASEPCVCPRLKPHDRKILAIESRTHLDVVARTAIKLLYSDEAEMKKLLWICPFSSCKEFNHANPQALMDHIMTCDHSSDSKICCAGCKKYKADAHLEKEPAHLEREREPVHSERESSAKMDLRRPFRKLSSLFQASIRSNQSTASSSRTGSIVSAGSPRNSQDITHLEQGAFRPSPLPLQTYLCELAETSPGELDDTCRPYELSEREASPVEHLPELASAPRHELADPATHTPKHQVEPGLRRRGVPPSPPPIQTGHASETPDFREDIHGGWVQNLNSDETFFGNGFTESPTGLQPEDPDSFNIFQSVTHGSFSDMEISPIGSINMSPSSSQGHVQQAAQADLVPQAYDFLRAAEGPMHHIQHGLLPQSDFSACLQPNFATPFSSHGPVHQAQSPWTLSNMNAVAQTPREHCHSQTRTSSGSTTASASTFASASTGSFDAFVNVAAHPVHSLNVLKGPETLPNFTASAGSRERLRSCRYQPCDFRPKGKPSNHNAYMRKHELSHRPNQHRCPQCGNMLSRRDNLKTHLKRGCKGFLGRMMDSSSPEESRCMHERAEQA